MLQLHQLLLQLTVLFPELLELDCARLGDIQIHVIKIDFRRLAII